MLPGPAARSLVVTADPLALDELTRLAATAGTQLEVAADGAAARRGWCEAPFVVVAADALASCTRARLPRRSDVVLLGDDLDDAAIWQRAVELGAAHVVFLPDAERWLTERFADAAESAGGSGLVVAVVGGRGGAGATTFACALAVTAARCGRTTLLADVDPLGGGVDLVFRGEHEPGLRWPDLAQTRGRLPAAALCDALPRMQGLSVLSWGRGTAEALPVDALEAVLDAAQRAYDVVVLDLPRAVDDAARAALAAADMAVLVVPNEVRAVAAASRVATTVGALCADLRLVTRGPAPGGLTGHQVATALGLPLIADLRAEPALDLALEHGTAPAHRGRGPLAAACVQLLDDLLPSVRRAA